MIKDDSLTITDPGSGVHYNMRTGKMITIRSLQDEQYLRPRLQILLLNFYETSNRHLCGNDDLDLLPTRQGKLNGLQRVKFAGEKFRRLITGGCCRITSVSQKQSDCLQSLW